MVPDVCYKVSGTQRCINTDPGFHCMPCPKRYKGNQPFGMGIEAAKRNKQVSRCYNNTFNIYCICHLNSHENVKAEQDLFVPDRFAKADVGIFVCQIVIYK